MSKTTALPLTYLLTFAALILLTGTTVALSYVDFGVWHSVVGLGIAVLKAMLIGLFFMHLLRSQRVTWIIALSGVFFLAILLGLTMTDFLTRNWSR